MPSQTAPSLDFHVTIRPDGPGQRLIATSPYLSSEMDLCAFERAGKALLPRSLTPLEEGRFLARFNSGPEEIRAVISVEKGAGRLKWSVECGGAIAPGAIFFPFLSALTLGSSSHWVDGFSLSDRQGRPLLRRRDSGSPLLVTDGERSLVILRSGELVQRGCSLDQMVRSPGLEMPVSGADRQVFQGEVVLLEGGWPGAFSAIREHLRASVDLQEYQRDDLQWYSEQFVQHFTFLYGQEILDLERGEFDLERFLDDGERDFGGYDGFLIWGVYPRIGVDERTQWDFYDDFPGGREGLRQMSRRARERGVRFFVPYKPWDRSAEQHDQPKQPHEEQLAQLIDDTDADGVFLDTMDLITPEFRQAIDQRRPGVVFCSEGRARGAALDLITGSWEQSPNRRWQDGNWAASVEAMPQVDMLRFALPEHRLFVINRHSMAGDRIRITQRGFFNGMGWVVWQDIFGLTLPYTPAEAALLKKCRTLFREHRAAVNSPAPIPLIETGVAGLYANEFPVESKRLWTFYNDNDAPLSAAVCSIRPREGFHLVDVWNGREARLSPDGCLVADVDALQVGCVVELPRLLELSEDGARASQARPGQEMVIAQGDRKRVIAAEDGWTALPRGLAPVRVSLVSGKEVLDIIYVEGEG